MKKQNKNMPNFDTFWLKPFHQKYKPLISQGWFTFSVVLFFKAELYWELHRAFSKYPEADAWCGGTSRRDFQLMLVVAHNFSDEENQYLAEFFWCEKI